MRDSRPRGRGPAVLCMNQEAEADYRETDGEEEKRRFLVKDDDGIWIRIEEFL